MTARASTVLVIVPALNEEASVALVVKGVLAAVDAADVLVVDDGSADRTAEVARAAGATVVSMPFNVGVGGAVRVGFRYAERNGYERAVQVDADGQHDPASVPDLLERLSALDFPEIVVGARFAGRGTFEVGAFRRVAMRVLSARLSRVTRTRLTDVTSGFRAYNRPAIELFARTYPSEYLMDTVESLMIASQAGASVVQVPVEMHPRQAGNPSQPLWRSASYLARVLLMLVVTVLRTGRLRISYEEDG